MNSPTTSMTAPATDRADALAERLFAATLGALELYSVYLGAELGLYRALAQNGPLTPSELAERGGIAPRYALEWLEQQAVAGLLDVDHPGAPADARRYALALDHARVLTDPDDAAHVAPFAHMLAGIGGVLPRVADAYRSGGGVPYPAYGHAFRHGQGHPKAWKQLRKIELRLTLDGAPVGEVTIRPRSDRIADDGAVRVRRGRI